MEEIDIYRDGYKSVYQKSIGGISYPGQGRLSKEESS